MATSDERRAWEADGCPDSDPRGFGACGDCPECGSLSPWRCGCDVADEDEDGGDE